MTLLPVTLAPSDGGQITCYNYSLSTATVDECRLGRIRLLVGRLYTLRFGKHISIIYFHCLPSTLLYACSCTVLFAEWLYLERSSNCPVENAVLPEMHIYACISSEGRRR